ncbi:MAG: ABC transporter ATP-binding protein [Armatimonadota bacterium]
MMIECDHVIKYFTQASGSRLEWRLQDFRVTRGERVLVTGPSGCGKTTLLNLIAGLLRPDSGAIMVCGTSVQSLSTAAADRFRGETLGLIFQSFQLLPSLTVLNNLLIGARYGRKWAPDEAKQRALHLLDEVGLHDRLHHRPAQLSLGEQQRVAIARALINEPPILLADEPTASLDQTNAERVLDLLCTLCTQHEMTLITVSHDQQIASRFDRTVDLTACMYRSVPEVDHV